MTCALLVRLAVRPGSERRFEELIADLRARSLSAERGLVGYDFFRGTEPSTYVGVEVFADRAAFDEHQQSPHHGALADELERVIVEQHLEWIDPVAGASALPIRTATARRAWWDDDPSATHPRGGDTP